MSECTRRSQAGWGNWSEFRTPLRQDHSQPEGRRGLHHQALMGVRRGLLGRQMGEGRPLG